MALGDGFDAAVDGVDLVIARSLAAAVVVVWRLDGRALFAAGDALPAAIALPEFLRAGELVERKFPLDRCALPGSVVHQKSVAVAAEGERRVKRLGIAQRLLHAVAERVLVVLGLDHGDGQVGSEVEDVVRALLLAPAVQLAAHDDATFGEADLFPDLRREVPPRALQCRVDVLRADVSLGELLLVWHSGQPVVMMVSLVARHTTRASPGREGRTPASVWPRPYSFNGKSKRRVLLAARAWCPILFYLERDMLHATVSGFILDCRFGLLAQQTSDATREIHHVDAHHRQQFSSVKRRWHDEGGSKRSKTE